MPSDNSVFYVTFFNAPNDKYRAFCVGCNKTFLIDGSEKSQVRSHISSPTHLDKEKQLKNQATFCKSTDDGVFIVKKQNFASSSDEQIMKAEILQAPKTVGSNFSFASANGDGDRFRQMFPDSNIAKGFSQNETKMMYVIKFGLSPYFKESLKNDFYSKAFCFKFDETISMRLYQWHIADYCLLITALLTNLLNIFLSLLKKLAKMSNSCYILAWTDQMLV